ncbi:MAG: DUF433 domain-containing protein [Anaerolineae bacterium]|nr:DUF433 domain-containing protein [Anaerolineae bacterium]
MVAIPISIDVPLQTDEHGKIRIGGTRVLLELVIRAFWRGETAEAIVDSYPTLKLADVYAVIAYYLTHRAEVDAYIQQADANSARIQRDIEVNYSPDTLALRARLRALRDEKRPGSS